MSGGGCSNSLLTTSCSLLTARDSSFRLDKRQPYAYNQMALPQTPVLRCLAVSVRQRVALSLCLRAGRQLAGRGDVDQGELPNGHRTSLQSTMDDTRNSGNVRRVSATVVSVARQKVTARYGHGCARLFTMLFRPTSTAAGMSGGGAIGCWRKCTLSVRSCSLWLPVGHAI
jgi:hypothetical protein